jgi:type I restriction enzyme S subunit
MGLREHFNSIAQGAAQQNISKEKVDEAKVACPPPEISHAADALLVPLFEQRKVFQQTNANLRATRDLLLPGLISGKIDVESLDIATEDAA